MNIELQNILTSTSTNVNIASDAIKAGSKETIPLSALKVGDSFMAKVLDVKYGEVILELIKGSSIIARVSKENDLNIGDTVRFSVKNTGDSIALEILSKETSTDKNIMELLKNSGFAVNKENASVVKALMKEGLPVSGEGLSRAMFFYHNSPSDKLSSMLFALKEQLPDTGKAINLLQKSLAGDMVIKDELMNLLKGAGLSEKEALTLIKSLSIDKNVEKNILQKSNSNIEQVLKEAIKAVLPDIRQDLKGETTRFYKDVEQILSKLTENNDLPKETVKNINIIKEDIKFMESINNDKLYVQIPFTAGKHENNCELIVIKGGKTKEKGKISAYINLDTAYLGYVGVFVMKEEKNITLDFYTDNKNTEGLISGSKRVIANMLKEKGYNVTGIFLKEYKKRFSLTDNEVTEGDTARYSFDVRA